VARPPQPSTQELTEQGLRHFRAGDAASARRSFEGILAREPEHLAALSMLGLLAMQSGAYALAAPLFERATKVGPEVAALHSNLGETLRRLGRRREALGAFQRALELSPQLPELHYNLALTFEQLAEFEPAASAYEAALQLKPDFAGAVLGLLGVLRASAHYERAITAYTAHAPRVPDSAGLRCAVAGVLADVFRIDEAVAHLERALALEPGSAFAHAELGAALLERGEADAAAAQLRRAVELEPSNATYHGNLVYVLPFSASMTGARLLEEANAFAARHAAPSVQAPPRASASRPLRVGYVSPDFRAHPAASFLRPLFRQHDRTRVHVIAYSNTKRTDAVTDELKALVDDWRDISQLDDESAAALIQQDEVDVLVDLAQHSARNRLLLFARRPAPVQVSWLGYPATTGIAAIDYRLTTAELDPHELGNGQNSETLLWLPETFWCYGPTGDEPDVHALPALSNGYVTFGSLNSFKKASDVALELWASVLASVPNSRLIAVAPPGTARERMFSAFQQKGVASERIELCAPMPRAEYFGCFGRIDVALDSTPYAGGTTSLDALWMGVPMVTLKGDTAVSRAGAALLGPLGLSRLIAASQEEYVERARALAQDLSSLGSLRAGLRARLLDSPLLDAPRFAHGFEQTLFEGWQRGPRSLSSKS
jgi:predicted O-linked N-acetylglucosamine transferase (SPINDLY family)